jgi:hypothetical protein
LFEASTASAEITALVEPSLRMEGALLDMVRELTAVVVAPEPCTTWTATVAVRPEAVAVTVMVLKVGSPATERVAVAEPVSSVVP